MKETAINETVFRILRSIAPDADPEQLKPDDNIRQTLGMDSFDYLQFIIALDDALHIQTPEEDYGKIESLRTLMEYIQSHRKRPVSDKEKE